MDLDLGLIGFVKRGIPLSRRYIRRIRHFFANIIPDKAPAFFGHAAKLGSVLVYRGERGGRGGSETSPVISLRSPRFNPHGCIQIWTRPKTGLALESCRRY
jgi:hypothetical protein